jgi:prepilin-type N-terminal cleavage/methylation domain-containing protein
MGQRKAFTLVELLVVIAIIALLMSILMPALARVRKQAKTVMGQSNLKHLGLCWSMYLGASDGYFPYGWQDTSQIHPFVACQDQWTTALRPYYKDMNLLLCPNAIKLGSDVGGTPYGGLGTFIAWGEFGESDWNPPMEAGLYGSYGLNGYVYNPPGDVSVIEGHPTSNNWRRGDVKGAALIPLVTDNQWIDHWPHHADVPPEFDGQPWGTDGWNSSIRICLNRHEGNINSVYLDFSVRSIGLKSIWRQKWHRTYDINFGLPDWPEWMKKFPEPEGG